MLESCFLLSMDTAEFDYLRSNLQLQIRGAFPRNLPDMNILIIV